MSQQDVRPTQSDYERIGGGEAVRQVVNRFYELVVADPTLSHFFTDIDMATLKRHQALLISQVLGGPAEYDGRALGEAHQGLGIAKTDFDQVVVHLVAALREAGVPEDIIGRAGVAVGATEGDIVEAGSA